MLKLSPGSTNTIPGAVSFSLDIRSHSDAVVARLEEELKRDFARLAAGEDIDELQSGGTPGVSERLEVTWRTDSAPTATVFNENCIKTVREAALGVLGRKDDLIKDMVSGAGHDSVYASKHCPTSMIFVPCKNGISHNPTEWTSPDDCGIGAQVLLQSVLKYDGLREKL